MLTHLQIRDFAIVEHLALELYPGMTAITGETGAGKSIMVDALSLLLGERADSTAVRSGAPQADLSAVFDLRDLPAARAWLAQRDLDSGGDCVLRRIIGREGRSRSYINATPQPLQALKDLGDLLVDIHGQHEHQSLLRRDLQRQLLDDCAGHQELLAEVGRGFRTLNDCRRQLEALRRAGSERAARQTLLRYQVQELQALNLDDQELAALKDEHRRLANAGRLLAACQQALSRIYENDEVSAHGLLGQAAQELHSLTVLDPRLAAPAELLGTALIQVQEASDELRRYAAGRDLDPERLDWVEQRLAAIQELARKHRVAAEELPSLLTRLEAELAGLDHSGQHLEQLEAALAQASEKYRASAATLSDRRRAAAAGLEARIGQAMQTLGMPGGRFAITLEPQQTPSPWGLEAVEFLVSANPGQPLRPLSKVASGGELSRISLAIQVITARSARIPTLVFDEVDSGIGGAIAEIVGRQLRTLGEQRQVLSVTHLPQVAAQAHHHLHVVKHTDGRSTHTAVQPLDAEARIQEIGRMLGGMELTDYTLAHAREMVERGQDSRQGAMAQPGQDSR
ncbi:MAG: DNA repair protein RecN [Pseudomonadota bacterium]|nr:DNA repair protein RecN [Pseudomonadota bacterium]